MAATGEPARLPSQALMSPSVPVWKPPSCTSTTMDSMPWARNSGMSALTVCASSRNDKPATPVGVTMVGVALSVMPMNATLTPFSVLTP